MSKKFVAAILGLSLVSGVALAALKEGVQAPAFSAPATLAGKPFTFSLQEALKKGPVVLYFYPAAFTKGCTVEAHLFAEATEKFEKMGATVIGVSKDDIDTLNKFSVEACKSKFALAADPKLSIAESYDAVMLIKALGYSSRTSYVIAPDGKILSALNDMKPEPHVALALATVQRWHDAQPKK